MTTLGRLAVSLFWLAAITAPVGADIMGREEMGVVFKDGAAATLRYGRPDPSTHLISWSDDLVIVEDAMIWRPFGEARSPVAWIESEPVPVSINWRPPQQVNMKLSLKGRAGRDDFQPRVFVRYGCDRVHWSTWQPAELNKPEAAAAKEGERAFQLRYEIDVVAPDTMRDRYNRLMGEWRKTDPDWGSNEEELCRWIAKENPDFFRDQFPFVGYWQFLIEDPRWKHVSLQGIDVETSWGVGGRSMPVKRGDEPLEGSWRFVLKSEQSRTGPEGRNGGGQTPKR